VFSQGTVLIFEAVDLRSACPRRRKALTLCKFSPPSESERYAAASSFDNLGFLPPRTAPRIPRVYAIMRRYYAATLFRRSVIRTRVRVKYTGRKRAFRPSRRSLSLSLSLSCGGQSPISRESELKKFCAHAPCRARRRE